MPDHRTPDHLTEAASPADDALQAEPEAPATRTLNHLAQARELRQRLTGLHLVYGRRDDLTMFGAHLALLHRAANAARTPVWLAAHDSRALTPYAGIPAQAQWIGPWAALDVVNTLMRTGKAVPLLIVVDGAGSEVFFRSAAHLAKIARFGETSQTSAVVLTEHPDHVSAPLLRLAASVTRIEHAAPGGTLDAITGPRGAQS